MNEAFLHYIWQLQYFDKSELLTTTGERINIINPGILNGDAGPDFLQAKINIGGIEWYGSVEIHVQSSGWYEHKHQEDAAYENVVLHVVWKETKPVFRTDGSRLATLVLHDRVDESLLASYQKLVNTAANIPCARYFEKINPLIKHAMIDRAAMKRLEIKASRVLKMLAENKGDWEETTYQLLAGNLGFKVNQDPFQLLARALPYRIIQKHSNNLIQIEALLFGQAGFLSTKLKDPYVTQLFTEYQFLSKKYGLNEIRLEPLPWKFMRLRPANFPTLRLAQFASVLNKRRSLFASIIEATDYNRLLEVFDIQTSTYWHKHYRFGKRSPESKHLLGKASIENIMINTIAPLLVAYGKQRDEVPFIDRAVSILQSVPAEENKITRLWKKLHYIGQHAFDSQGLLELYNGYCTQRACLNCQIGNAILKPGRA